MSELHVFGMIVVIALVTALLRFFPFLMFGGGRKTPAVITYLSGVLPYAIMAMLVVYCLRNTPVVEAPHGLPELIAGGTVVLLHIWRKNTLLSIAAGTVLYMFLVQTVFV